MTEDNHAYKPVGDPAQAEPASIPFTLPETPPTVHATNSVHARAPMVIMDDDDDDKTRSILLDADKIINGDRNQAYGNATPAFTQYAIGWSALLGVEIRPEQVALCMAWMKMCRQSFKPKRDNLVDAAGYIGLADQIISGTK